MLTRCVVATERDISVDADQYEHERNDFPQESAGSWFGKGLHVDIRGVDCRVCSRRNDLGTVGTWL